jgi:hypothetical protein
VAVNRNLPWSQTIFDPCTSVKPFLNCRTTLMTQGTRSTPLDHHCKNSSKAFARLLRCSTAKPTGE